MLRVIWESRSELALLRIALLKVVLPVAGLILSIFSLTVPEGARSQTAQRRYRTGTDLQGSSSGAAGTEENCPRPLRRLQPEQCGAVVRRLSANQTDRGQMNGFDFYRDLLGATRPGMTFDDLYSASVANKPQVMATQRRLLESRYNLEPRLDPVVTMSRGKPLAVGPTAKLPAGITWEALSQLSPAEIRATGTSSRTRRPLTPPKAAAWAAKSSPRCSPVTSWPSNVMRPDAIRSRPKEARPTTDLPLSIRPASPTTSPARTSSEKPLTEWSAVASSDISSSGRPGR